MAQGKTGLLPRALDRSQTSTKPRQALLDYALCHGFVRSLLAPNETRDAPGSTGLPA